MPLRLLVTGQLQTPSIDAVLALFGRDVVVNRIVRGLA
jgi:glutamyl-tRNA synthetase